MLATSFAVGFSLFLVLSLFIYLNSENEWSKLNTRLAIQAKIIANNSMSSVIFDDPSSAEEILSALKADSSILDATIVVSGRSNNFAHYNNPNSDSDKLLNKELFALEKWLQMRLLVKHEIVYRDKNIAAVLITASLSDLYHNNLQYIYVALLISFISMFLTMLLSNVLLKRIIEPILTLTKTAKRITTINNYSLRVEKLSEDEVGDLTRSFNEMLDEIQRKDHVLEKTVAERTSELIQLNKKFQHQATHDPLTGLANRLLFDDRLQLELSHAHRLGKKVAVMYFDLDHFKAVNDTLGHDTGDELLIAVTQRMKDLVREDDTLCRIGGDEFTLILNAIESSSDIELVAQKMLSVFSDPFFCNNHELSISSSIGISLYPEHTQSKEQLKQFADIAMYYSKQSGRNNYCFFMPEMQKENEKKLGNRDLLKRRLKFAVDNAELQIYYQPQVDMHRRIIAVEALLRWRDAENKMISPEIFIPLAEESGLIQELEEWAFIEVCEHYAKWINAGLPKVNISLNISGYRLRQKTFIHFVDQTLEKFSLSADYFVFEISESEIMQNLKETAKVLNQLHSKGIKIAVDHFGTSYTSLNYLQQLPIDIFKIDAQFIRQLGSRYDETSVVQAIIGLANSLNKSVIAMGVEQEIQEKRLLEFHCDAIQGYLIAKPMTEENIRLVLTDTHYLTEKS